MSTIWNTLLVNPILNLLVMFYQLSGSLGFSIIFLTITIRAVLLPATLPSLKNIKKQRDLQPEFEKLKKKYKHDKRKLAEKQMEILKNHGINPASGCLTQFSMLFVFAALYSVIRMFSGDFDISAINDLVYFNFLKIDPATIVNTQFLYFDLAKPDPYYILAIATGVLQFLYSKMIQPYADVGEAAAKKTPDKKDDIAYNMQEQMLYMMPVMVTIISLKLPAGVVLNIFTTTLFLIVQQYFISGLGGLKSLLLMIRKKP